MKNHPFPLVRGNLNPLLGLLAWLSGGGLARAITDLLMSNPTTSSILCFDSVTDRTPPPPPPSTASP